ncbi:hypothetical protein CMUST_01440 [Corynebacterium mustelae]|uniref:Uncharacterized protein n=1 Tax=Corynebacterium mustelae TaxID=571915 RepID=A0A0G3H0Q5_9CORY|nr:hypothetical protein CMUST_01440 [Corynebacterium mustelae]
MLMMRCIGWLVAFVSQFTAYFDTQLKVNHSIDTKRVGFFKTGKFR